MSAYLIELAYKTDGVTAEARIAVRDPLWNEAERLAITPACMSAQELRHWGEKAKAQIDAVVHSGVKRFKKLPGQRKEPDTRRNHEH